MTLAKRKEKELPEHVNVFRLDKTKDVSSVSQVKLDFPDNLQPLLAPYVQSAVQSHLASGQIVRAARSLRRLGFNWSALGLVFGRTSSRERYFCELGFAIYARRARHLAGTVNDLQKPSNVI